ncbi:MAG TPA: M20/M25/M40 family metallo-hydrolase [Nitrososphaeraceae archaeon]|nr:M20/M25/M40 family metallo-hydrolase [Nitrososphaeraceae archaeon]
MCKDRTSHHPNLDKNIITNTKTIFFENKSFNEKLDDTIVSLIDQVSLENLKSNLTKLSSYHTRHTKSVHINTVAEWLKNEFECIGYRDVSYHHYKEKLGTTEYNLKNVICKKDGNYNNNKSIILCAHYDSRMSKENDYKSRAPGANDNASGVSAVLEIARILYSVQTEYNIQFVLFSAEEQNLAGSKHYSEYIKEKDIDIFRLINLDMIGHPYPEPGKIIIEVDNQDNYRYNKVQENDKNSIELGKLMRNIILRYTNLQFEPGLIYSSDYEDFESKGFVVVGVYDGGAIDSGPYLNPDYHSITDTPEKIDWNYLTIVTKIVLATIVSLNKDYY